MKIKKIPMYDLGIQKVQVPQAGNVGNIFGDSLSLGLEGAQLGSNFGPYGTAIGGTIGAGYGLYKGITDYRSENILNQNATRLNTAVDVLNQRNGAIPHYQGDVYQQRFKAKYGLKSSKNIPIEIEGNETVFSRNGNNFMLKKIANGPSHEKGGIDYLANEGDVIFPKDLKDKALDLYKKRDFIGLESLRMQLPDKPSGMRVTDSNNTDLYKKGSIYIKPENRGKFNALKKRTGKTTEELTYSKNPLTRKRAIFAQNAKKWHHGKAKYGDGTMSLEPVYGEDHRHVDDNTHYGVTIPMFDDGTDYVSSIGDDHSLMSMNLSDFNPQLQQPSNSYIPESTYRNNSYPGLDSSYGGILGGLSSLGGSILSNAPSIYNTIRGTFDKPEVQQASYVTPRTLNYTDISDPNRRKSLELQRFQLRNARNTSAGNLQNYRANANEAMVGNFNRQQDINNFETGRRDQIYNTNVGIENQSRYYNAGETDIINDINAQNRAAQRSYLNAGLEGLSKGFQLRSRQKALEDRDRKLIGVLGSQNFGFDPDTYNLQFRG